jgi:CCR4-NOT transcription complex subunit 1
MANQLRYPNSHTYYFSCALLELFSQDDASSNSAEQITRVLLERIVCNRPHPVRVFTERANQIQWGLLITFTSLLKQERFNFWTMPFVKKAPEVFARLASTFSDELD